MKSFFITLVVVLASQAYAGPKVAPKVATLAESKAYIESTTSLKKYKQAAESGRLSESAKKEMAKYFESATESLSGISPTRLEVLTSIRPEALDKVVHLINLTKNGKAEEKIKAEKDLQLLSLAGKYTTISKLEAETIEKVTEMADYNQAAKDFKAELIKTLDLNIVENITEAISTASKGKITLDQIKSCMI